jgi:DNA-binding beta-propeller fold protein YncE
MKSRLKMKCLLLCLISILAGVLSADDTMHLTDEPGNWFKSQSTGTPVSIINPGERVDFVIGNCCTNTRHTVTLLMKPVGSQVTMDQDSSQNGTLSVRFDVPGVYLFVCKIHPYMTGVVAVRDARGSIPDVTSEELPFLSHLGVPSLPALAVLNVITTIAPTDEEKRAKWDIRSARDEFRPPIPGVGEVWVGTQFERVPGQRDERGVPKPGTITVVDSATFTVEREINGLGAQGLWNNPHNMWANFSLDTIYNSNWFGKWINKIDRETGIILGSITVGEAPTHIITIPTPQSPQRGFLTIPLSAEHGIAKVEDRSDGLHKVDERPTGEGRNHPHGHWLTCGEGDRIVVPNVFKGMGVAGSISIVDTATGGVIKEFTQDSNDPFRWALQMPIAAGECHVRGVHKAYVANVVTGMVTVINVDDLKIIKNISVTFAPDGERGLDLLHTLQAPIQTPVSPDERWVATAVLSLTTVPRPPTGSADHVAIIDSRTDEVVAWLPVPRGAHGINWGAKLGGGYYAYVTSQHANVLTIIDPDPNGDGDGHDAQVVGSILLANGSDGAGVTDGTGGQGVKPLPMTHDGWIQPTVELAGQNAVSPEVREWINQLTEQQKNPRGHLVERLNAQSLRLARGFALSSPQLEWILESDDVRLRIFSGITASQVEESVQVEVSTLSPTREVEMVRVVVVSSVSRSPVLQKLELFDFTTSRWETVDVRAVGTSDQTTVVSLTEDPQRFIEEGTGRILARVGFKRTGVFQPWRAEIDLVRFFIARTEGH